MSLSKRLCVALLPTVLLLGLGEATARIYYWYRHGFDARWLVAIFEPQRPYEYPVTDRTYTAFDPCTERDTTFPRNSQGARGKEWSLEKPQGTLRVLAVGASTTYGVNNQDHETWPAVLEAELRQRTGRPIEVLNGGVPEIRLEGLISQLSTRWLRYRPDLVIYL